MAHIYWSHNRQKNILGTFYFSEFSGILNTLADRRGLIIPEDCSMNWEIHHNITQGWGMQNFKYPLPIQGGQPSAGGWDTMSILLMPVWHSCFLQKRRSRRWCTRYSRIKFFYSYNSIFIKVRVAYPTMQINNVQFWVLTFKSGVLGQPTLSKLPHDKNDIVKVVS